jgi:NDP-sugar pyrophosphorylase family protein
MQLVIPMSGMSQRFMEKGYRLPKPFIEISGRPIIQHVIEMFPGVEDVLFIVNREHFENPEFQIESRLKNISPKANIVVIDSHKLGPAWAIHQAREHIDKSSPVVVNYCDFSCTWNFKHFQEELSSGVDGLIATYTGFHPHMIRNSKYAFLKLDDRGHLIDIQEKSSFTDNPMDEPASSGTYGFGSGQILLDAVADQISSGDSFNNEYYSSLTYKNMISAGKVVKSFNIEKFFQWGTPEDFEEFKYVKDYFAFKKDKNVDFIDVDTIEILAAGNGARFIERGYKTPKPFLPAGGSFLALQAMDSLGTPVEAKGILLQESHKIPEDLAELLMANNVRVRKVDGLTKGQAHSALFSISDEHPGSSIIGTCDSIIFPNVKKGIPGRGKILGVWVTKPSEYARNNPNQFGWVLLDNLGCVIECWVKETPQTDFETFVITGTFYFGDKLASIDLLNKFLFQSHPVNGEYYLDSLLDFAKDDGWEVLGLIPDWFMSLGTPNEYESYIYWEKLFSERPDLLVIDES